MWEYSPYRLPSGARAGKEVCTVPGERVLIDYECRQIIEELINKNFSFDTAARKIGVHPTTISREVKRNRIEREGRINHRTTRNVCAKSPKCKVRGLCSDACQGRCRSCRQVRCSDKCPDFEPKQCERLKKKPYVCNACPYLDFPEACDSQRWFYDARAAQDAAEKRSSEARRGVDIDSEQMEEMVAIVKPLMKKGQSIEHIWNTHPGQFPVSARTFRNYVAEGVCGVTALDEVRAVRYKKRRRKKVPEEAKGGIAAKPIYDGRRYEDFSKLDEEEIVSAVEMDCVESARGSKKTILTLYFRRHSFQLMLLLEQHTLAEVKRVLDDIERLIGLEQFRLHMGTCVTDHGHEFNNFELLEASCTVPGAKRWKIFYCDPSRPDQKGRCEKCHVEIRRILPKKTCFARLEARDLSLVASHVNSYTRPALGGAAPIDLAMQVLPEELFEGLGIEKIPPEDVVMKPALLPHLL